MLNLGSQDHQIYWGDAIKAFEVIPNSSVDLIFADPPYNIGKKFGSFVDKWASDDDYANWCYKWLALCITKLKENGSMYIMTSTQAMPYLDLFLRNHIEILSRIVWHYDSSGVQARNYYGSMYEPMLFCVKDIKNYTFNAEDIKIEAKTGAVRRLIDYRKPTPTLYNSQKVPGNVWNIPRVRYRMPEYEVHPTQKPEALLERIIKASSNVGDIILDPFSGTFTTSAVAKRLNRKSIGFELQEEYIKIGLRRLEIQKTYKDEVLKKPVKSYERKQGEQFSLFESK